MLWDPDEVESESHTKMMHPLIDIADGSEDLEDGEVVDRYRVISRSPCNSTLLLDIWQLHTRFVSSRILLSTKELKDWLRLGVSVTQL